MWKVHTELRQSSTHPRPQKTCSLSGILGHTCNIQKSFKSYLMWQLITLKEKTNKRQTLPGDTEGIGTAGWGCPQKGSCAMLTLGWNWELKLQGLCVCGVGCGMWLTAVYTHNVTHLVCAFFLESGILLHTRQMVPMKLVIINTGTEVLLTDVDMHCCLHWGGGEGNRSWQACDLTYRTSHLLSPQWAQWNVEWWVPLKNQKTWSLDPLIYRKILAH